MARTARKLPDELGESFDITTALAAGVTPTRLRALDLDRSIRGVCIRPSPPAADDAPLSGDRAERAEILRRCRAYSLVMPASAFFVGRTAAAIYGLPLFPTGDDDLCVAVFTPSRALRRRGTRGGKVSPSLATTRTYGGLRTASPASVWAMLGTELSIHQLIVLGDAIVRVPRGAGGRPQPEKQLATVAQLERAADSPRRRYRAELLAALSLIRVGSMSPLETDFRVDACADGLPEPELDVEIRDAHGRLLGIADVVYRDQRVIVEIEGDHHRTDRTQWNRDIEKHAAYVAAGWEVIRLSSQHIRSPKPQAAAIVRAVLRRRGWRG